ICPGRAITTRISHVEPATVAPSGSGRFGRLKWRTPSHTPINRGTLLECRTDCTGDRRRAAQNFYFPDGGFNEVHENPALSRDRDVRHHSWVCTNGQHSWQSDGYRWEADGRRHHLD